jgi:hypothetical protein
MSDQPWGVQAPYSPLVRPAFMLGAALPMWGLVAGAVVSGTAWWWMTRWMQMGGLLWPPADRPSARRLVLVSENTSLVPVGGEAAPVAPAVLEGEVLEGAAGKPAPRRRAPKDAGAKPR